MASISKMQSTRGSIRLLLIGAFALLTLRVLYLQCAYSFGLAGVRRFHLESAITIAWISSLLLFVRLQVSARPLPNRVPLWMYLAVAIGAISLYAPAIGLPLLSDDHVLVDWAQHKQFIGAQEPFIRPCVLAVWWILSRGPQASLLLHGVNVALHAANATLLVGLLNALGCDMWFAMLGGFVFAAWPTQVEAVAWASGMFDVLMTTCVLSTAVAWTKWKGQLDLSRVLLLGCFVVAAVLSKETAVCLPLLLVLISFERWRLRAPSLAECSILAALILAAVVYAIWRVEVRDSSAVVPHLVFTRYAIKQQLAISFGGVGLPLTSDVIRRYPVAALAFMVSLYGIGQVALLAGQRHGSFNQVPILVGSAWIVGAALPTIGLLFVGNNLDGSRYLYLAVAGLALYLVKSCETLFKHYKVLALIAVGTVCGLIMIAIIQDEILIRDWRAAGVIQQSVLQAAGEAARLAQCSVSGIDGAPAVYKGTQVLRNGAIEAFRERYPSLAGTGRRSCILVWTGNGFSAQ